MLVRGGLEEERVKQISGFADRRLQVPNDAMRPRTGASKSCCSRARAEKC